MKSVLVVEDEKLIRQGIASMIKRSGVPVEKIYESNNGLAAMEILKENDIDVIFTDIRMPKMNGIELVQEIQSLENPPLAVAISGYDDFAYAVEMLRQGVREYILKPVEREKLKEILQKLEDEINHRIESEKNSEAIDKQLLKYILSDKEASPENMEVLSRKLTKVVGSEYQVVVAAERLHLECSDGVVLNDVDGQDVFVISRRYGKSFPTDKYIGISDCFSKGADIKTAYQQAKNRRGEAFLRGITLVDTDLMAPKSELVDEAKKLISSKAISAKVQLMGTDRLSELIKEWESIFLAASRGQINPMDFTKAIKAFSKEYTTVYKREFDDVLINPFVWISLENYKASFMKFIVEANAIIKSGTQVDATEEKIKAALEYVNANFAKDLNMAVVSNQVSMNYSLFSAEFKNYTGTNFVNYVKDLRMAEAKKLLIETELKVNEISTRVGYDNEKHFMKSFKTYVGVSPSEYRKNGRVAKEK
ncbi:Two-component response regulator, YesN/AraC family, consists of REC and AraC-type DNA-binding domains [Pseudobutyrivibrio sp. YE44]|uniref:response regulator transcription factor n=1 Tax=Pseudobutyrivibrio sp. YE44 TaxID=1520802 RepID=UPI00088657C1|nr:response regulator [Pseudobutyrivibrio sp. YE44]SDB19506.1 Two-component response regulator, YesN/AraC family, consists of REC and AraC-type DNA-binding domains [Pseudobutyrivibrio sp. YE44]